MPGPLLMVNPRRKVSFKRPKKKSKSATKRKTPKLKVKRRAGPRKMTLAQARKELAKRKPVKRKSPKRKAAKRKVAKKTKTRKSPKRKAPSRKGRAKRKTIAGVTFVLTKTGWRKMPERRRNVVARRKKRVVRRKRRTVKRRANPKRKRRTRRRVKRAAPKRRRRNPKRRVVRKRRRRRNTWYGQPRRHRKAARKGWSRRRRGRIYYKGKKYPRISPSTGRPYKRAKKYGRKTKGYSFWTNTGSVADLALPLALASVGFVGSYALMNIKAVQDQVAKLSPQIQKFIPVALPIGAAVAMMMLAPKIKALKPYSKHIYFLSFGLALAGGVAGVKAALSGTAFGAKLGLSGYTVSSMRGYVRRPMAGYVRSRGLGQMEERVPRTLGAPIHYRGSAAPPALPGQRMVRELGYESLSQKPFGLGLPQNQRRYNEFDWMGVYDSSAYE